LTTEQSALRKNLLERFSRKRSNLLPALHYVHTEFGYLPDWAMEVTGWHLGIPVSEVFGAATSYSELRIEPLPKTLLRICNGLGCDSVEREKLKSVIQTKFNSNPDIEIEMIPCAFLCALAPAVEVNGKWIGRANMDKISAEMIVEG